MSTLKGQNIRIMLKQANNSYSCIAMATNCTVTLTGNTENAETKDDTGLSQKPMIVSKGFSVTVDTLNVVDLGAVLTSVKGMQPVTLMWDETSTSNNQSAEHVALHRVGQAYFADLTATFNDRENSAKNIQFQGTGALTTLTQAPTMTINPAGSYTKGQYVRLLLSDDNRVDPTKVIAGAKQLSLHISVSLENSTTKDTAGDWVQQEPVALSYDISTTALVRSADVITSSVQGQAFSDLETIYETGEPILWQIANVTGDNNRTKVSVIVSGTVVITQLTLNGPTRQSADYSAQLTGYGDYSVAV